tara:strand:- start:1514 stop:1711 length:198 start_codon:yes stop_codon:yes gene_type:complete
MVYVLYVLLIFLVVFIDLKKVGREKQRETFTVNREDLTLSMMKYKYNKKKGDWKKKVGHFILEYF